VTQDLNDLTTEELRRRAFDKAQAAHDLHFFWDLTKHLRASTDSGGRSASQRSQDGRSWSMGGRYAVFARPRGPRYR
jgi:hypothetical protein